MKIEQRYLLDTNILTRLKNTSDSDHQIATEAIRKILFTKASIHICPQNIVEYRVVATRPPTVNGYGLSSEEAISDISNFEAVFPLLLEKAAIADIHAIWKDLVANAGTLGKTNHDARLLATAVAHSCSSLLTFNDRDFLRYAPTAPQVNIINPRTLSP